MTIIHLAFYRGSWAENPKSKLLDNIICLLTRSKYSHVELVIDYYANDQNGSCWSSSEWDGGVRNKFIHLDPSRWSVIPYNSKFTKQELVDFFNAENGKTYDYLGALGVVIPFFKANPNRWFCFEIVGEALGFVNGSRLNANKLIDLL